jgi:hypothetical protein
MVSNKREPSKEKLYKRIKKYYCRRKEFTKDNARINSLHFYRILFIFEKLLKDFE